MYRPALREIVQPPSFGRHGPKTGGAFMKRVGSLFDKVFTEENLYQAYLDARRKKRSKRATFEFETNLGGNLASILDEVHAGCYRPRPYHTFWVTEPKPRLIHAPTFRDRVVQHAIYRVVYPIFDRSFISTSFACRIGFGTHSASDYLQKALQRVDPCSYFLQLDIRKFFYSIDRGILSGLVSRRIKDARLVDIMMLFAEYPDPVGIPIGNLLSQLYALIYLNPVDHFIKRQLRISHYLRYVDDLVIVGVSRELALGLRAEIVSFLDRVLKLQLSRSTIARVKRGVNFVGYRTWRSRRFIRKHSLYKFRRSVSRGDVAAVVSILGHARRTASLPHLISILREHGNDLPLPKAIRRAYDL